MLTVLKILLLLLIFLLILLLRLSVLLLRLLLLGHISFLNLLILIFVFRLILLRKFNFQRTNFFIKPFKIWQNIFLIFKKIAPKLYEEKSLVFDILGQISLIKNSVDHFKKLFLMVLVMQGSIALYSGVFN